MDVYDMIRRMGDALDDVTTDGYTRYPSLEQDAMRYWVLKEKVNITDLDQVLDKEIDQILNRSENHGS